MIAKEFLDENEATFYMKQLLAGLEFCHEKGIIHLDLKPENIVLKERDGKQLKIIDFGTAQDLTINPRPKVMVGTPEFIGIQLTVLSLPTSLPHLPHLSLSLPRPPSFRSSPLPLYNSESLFN